MMGQIYKHVYFHRDTFEGEVEKRSGNRRRTRFIYFSQIIKEMEWGPTRATTRGQTH